MLRDIKCNLSLNQNILDLSGKLQHSITYNLFHCVIIFLEEKNRKYTNFHLLQYNQANDFVLKMDIMKVYI